MIIDLDAAETTWQTTVLGNVRINNRNTIPKTKKSQLCGFYFENCKYKKLANSHLPAGLQIAMIDRLITVSESSTKPLISNWYSKANDLGTGSGVASFKPLLKTYGLAFL